MAISIHHICMRASICRLFRRDAIYEIIPCNEILYDVIKYILLLICGIIHNGEFIIIGSEICEVSEIHLKRRLISASKIAPNKFIKTYLKSPQLISQCI